MKLIEEHERDEAEYYAYIEQMEEESMNYERLQQQEEMQRKTRLI
jgi:hypothetical protein